MWLFNSRLKKIVLLTILVLVGLVFAFKPLLLWYLQPGKHFSREALPPAPDFNQVAYWAAHPDRQDSADLRPDNSSAVDDSVDVFFVHPTTYFGPGDWNAEIKPDNFAAQGTEHIMATMASVFSDCCRTFAPHYRQAHLAAFWQPDSEATHQALEVAYQDVNAAFKHFLNQRDPQRPFILAGHSQGTLHSIRLLHEHVTGKPLQQQLVAAYVIGFWVPEAVFETTLPQMSACSDKEMTGCVITYDSYDNTGPGRDPEGRLPYWQPSGWYAANSQQTICVNPLSWTTGLEEVPASVNLGGIPMAREYSLHKHLTDQGRGFIYPALPAMALNPTSARCAEDGSLMVDPQDDTPFANPGSGLDKSLHPNDWNLFHMNIRANVRQRIQAFNREF